ncbi:hypothetical protein Gasu2_53870 [Galdieria sulphuraria]|nr:hypothetical protein Gasu2_53870 [Galdieria sulphuraria]
MTEESVNRTSVDSLSNTDSRTEPYNTISRTVSSPIPLESTTPSSSGGFSSSPSLKRTRHIIGEQVVPDFTVEGNTNNNNTIKDLEPQLEPFPGFIEIYSSLRSPIDGLKVADRRRMLKTYSKCFTGTEAIDWMTKKLELSREQAQDLGQRLIGAGIIQPVFGSDSFCEGEAFFRFQEDDDSNVLNLKRIWDPSLPTRHPCDLSRELLTKIALLCENYRIQLAADRPQDILSPYEFDYRKLNETEEFRQYSVATAELQGICLSGLSEKERLVFFINIYNALCLHAHITHGPPTSFFKRWIFFRSLCYRIAGIDFSLDDIEHGILRCNRFPPSLRFMRQFRSDDPKTRYMLSNIDGRIHFVISAGTRSDPPIRILEEECVEEELHFATEEFLNQSVRISKEQNEVILPKIFSWYSDDFPCSSSLLRWVQQYLYSDASKLLETMLQVKDRIPNIRYENFDWRSEARFNPAIVRRKRKRMERERQMQLQSGHILIEEEKSVDK